MTGILQGIETEDGFENQNNPIVFNNESESIFFV